MPGSPRHLISEVYTGTPSSWDGVSTPPSAATFLPFLRSEYVPYREFVKRRAKKKVTGYGCLFFVGLLFLIVGILLTVRFSRLYP